MINWLRAPVLYLSARRRCRRRCANSTVTFKLQLSYCIYLGLYMYMSVLIQQNIQQNYQWQQFSPFEQGTVYHITDLFRSGEKLHKLQAFTGKMVIWKKNYWHMEKASIIQRLNCSTSGVADHRTRPPARRTRGWGCYWDHQPGCWITLPSLG